MLLGTACSKDADEQALRERIAAMQQAAEERSLSGVMDFVTEDFGGSEGLDHARLKRMLQAQILSNAAIGATLGPLSIERQGDRATVSFSMILTGGSGRFVPDSTRAYQVVSGWRVVDGEWQVYHAEWR